MAEPDFEMFPLGEDQIASLAYCGASVANQEPDDVAAIFKFPWHPPADDANAFHLLSFVVAAGDPMTLAHPKLKKSVPRDNNIAVRTVDVSASP